jgi:hypothetical protein
VFKRRGEGGSLGREPERNTCLPSRFGTPRIGPLGGKPNPLEVAVPVRIFIDIYSNLYAISFPKKYLLGKSFQIKPYRVISRFLFESKYPFKKAVSPHYPSIFAYMSEKPPTFAAHLLLIKAPL